MIINSAKYCTLNQYMECRYESNLSILGEGTPDELNAAWQRILLEYMTLIGIDHPTAMLEINIFNTTNRINIMKTLVHIQRDCISKWGFPLEPMLSKFQTFGHTIKYPCTNDEMLTQLQTIENKEKEHNMRLKSYQTRLQNLRIAENKEHEQEDSRPHFLKLILQLEEARRIEIDCDKMTLEKFAVLYAEKTKAAKDSQKN
jgi:hypothetical protein